MQIERAEAVRLFQALGFQTADSWNKERMLNRLSNLNSTITDKTVIGDPELDSMLDEIITALNSGESVHVVRKRIETVDDDAAASDEEEAASAPVKKKRSSKSVTKEMPVKNEKTKTKPAKKKAAAAKEDKAEPVEKKRAGKKKTAKPTKKKAVAKEEKTSSKPAKKKLPALPKAVAKGKAAKVKAATKKVVHEKDAFGARVGSMGAAVNAVIKQQKKGKQFTAKEIAEASKVNLHRCRRHLYSLTKTGVLNMPTRATFAVV